MLGLLLAQAVVTARFRVLREAVLAASGVLANFGGVPLAFAFVATLGNAGVITQHLHLTEHGWSLYSFWDLVITYLYFLIPLMVLTVVPALDGLRVQWREAAQNNGATAWQYWRYVALPLPAPSLLGGLVLLFGTAFAAYASAAAMVGSSVPLVTLQIADALSGNVLVGQANTARALSLDMVLVAGLVMAVYRPPWTSPARASPWARTPASSAPTASATACCSPSNWPPPPLPWCYSWWCPRCSRYGWECPGCARWSRWCAHCRWWCPRSR